MTRSCLMVNQKLKAFKRHLKDVGCEVDHDRYAGVLTAKDGDTVVFRAIQKGRGQPWIATFIDSERITWKRGDT